MGLFKKKNNWYFSLWNFFICTNFALTIKNFADLLIVGKMLSLFKLTAKYHKTLAFGG